MSNESNEASLVLYGSTCRIRLIKFAAWFAAFEENLRQTSSARQVAPPEAHRADREQLEPRDAAIEAGATSALRRMSFDKGA